MVGKHLPHLSSCALSPHDASYTFQSIGQRWRCYCAGISTAAHTVKPLLPAREFCQQRPLIAQNWEEGVFFFFQRHQNATES